MQCRDPIKSPLKGFLELGETFKVKFTVEVPIVDLVGKDIGGEDGVRVMG